MYQSNKIRLFIAIAVLVASGNSCNQLPSANQLFKVAASPELRLSYNSTTTILNDGKLRSAFHAKWVNYMDENNQWKEIDPNFVKTERGFEMTKAPFEVLAPFYADEAATFNNNNRYDVATKEIIYDKPLEQTIQALGTNHVAGKIETGDLGWGKAQYVVYTNAYPQQHADLIYWVHQGSEPRLRKFIRFNQKLSQNTDFKFRVVYADDVEAINTGKNVTVKLKGAKGNRGNGWENFYIWDSKGGWAERKSIRFDFQKPMFASTGTQASSRNEYILTKHIEANYFNTATLPVFTDATATFYPAAGTNTPVDGYVAYGGFDSWATTHDAAVAINDPRSGEGGSYPLVASGHYGWSYRYDLNGHKIIARSYFLFDASSLTSGATISSATFSVYATAKDDSYNDAYSWFNVVQSSPAGTNNLVNADYSQCGAVTNPTYGASQIRASDITLSAYNDFPLSATGLSWISKTGITELGMREGHDATNTEIGAGSNVDVNLTGYFADQTGTTQDPVLAIIYSTTFPPTVTSPTSSSVSNNSGTLGANVTSDGGDPVTSRGICWGTSPSPTGNCIAEGGASTGIFTEAITGLPAGTLIYYRGYAINNTGTGYSADGTFTTLDIPTVTTPTSASVTNTSATLGANVTSNGGTPLTARGICWGTLPAPGSNCTAEGSTSTGVFTQAITGLPGGSLVYFRGYATNMIGTGYSADGTFTTLPTGAPVDWNNSNVQDIILAANRSFTFINGKTGGLYTLIVKQDATGGRTITWPSEIKWGGGIAPTLTTTANAADVIKMVYDGSNYLVTGTTLDIK